MNADMFETISYVAFTCSFLFTVIAIVLFFKLDIRTIIDDLSGKREERQIQVYREQNASYQKNRSLLPGRTGTKSEVMVTEEITELLYNGTVLLTENETVLLNEESVVNSNCYKLVLNEIVIHTGERI